MVKHSVFLLLVSRGFDIQMLLARTPFLILFSIFLRCLRGLVEQLLFKRWHCMNHVFLDLVALTENLLSILFVTWSRAGWNIQLGRSRLVDILEDVGLLGGIMTHERSLLRVVYALFR